MITLHGLTARQQLIADILWTCDTQEQVTQLIRSLPEPDRRDATTVAELMVWAVFDDVESVALADQYLERFRLNS